MSNILLEILPKIPQYEDIPYAADLRCQECGKGSFEHYDTPRFDEYAPIAIGWCDTDYGYMGVFECPQCHSKFRFHCGEKLNSDINAFELRFFHWVFMCKNYKEISKKIDES